MVACFFLRVIMYSCMELGLKAVLVYKDHKEEIERTHFVGSLLCLCPYSLTLSPPLSLKSLENEMIYRHRWLENLMASSPSATEKNLIVLK
jgi:hypothetical protein